MNRITVIFFADCQHSVYDSQKLNKKSFTVCGVNNLLTNWLAKFPAVDFRLGVFLF